MELIRIRNDEIKGRKDQALVIPDAFADVPQGTNLPEEPLTPRRLLILITQSREVKTTKEAVTGAKILDSLEAEHETVSERVSTELTDVVVLQDAWWDLLKPDVERFLLKIYKSHTGFILDSLEKDVPAGMRLPAKPEDEPEA